MGLRDIQLPTVINTSDSDFSEDFFVPALSNSLLYNRGVGFFSGSWLKINAQGMIRFAERSGYARWITSPILSEQDWTALQTGEAAKHDSLLRDLLRRNIEDLEVALARDTLSALAWLIADGIIEFKLALPRNKLAGGEFHDKFGIFEDEAGNRISFNGSYNESVQGTRNYESIKIFCSWNENFAPLVDSDAERFERLWNNFDPNVQVYNLPDAAKAQILKLRTLDRPYSKPDFDQLKRLRQRSSHLHIDTISQVRVPPEITLRDYQEKAIQKWLKAGGVGFFEMATGTGKTITSLGAMAWLFGQNRRLAIVIAVPYQHLVDQWKSDAEKFGLQPLLAYQSKKSWLNDLHQSVNEYNHGDRSVISVITTHTTFTSEDFQSAIQRLNEPALLIADEVHHLGAERSRTQLPDNISHRLALSATPDRWFDDEGSQALRNYFGETVFKYPLHKAIKRKILVPYDYLPQLVELTEDELLEYQALTEKVGKIAGREDDEDIQDALKMLLIKRARLLNNASNKLDVLADLVSGQTNLSHALFYCDPHQIDAVCKLLGWELDLIIGRFTAMESNDKRQQLLKEFADGTRQALVAMKCLDEGVDVPSTRTAFILASSSNPREFIQRRGRILRSSENKQSAVVYDLIAIPPQDWSYNTISSAERSIIARIA